eukprot:2306191-Prymnesium_polylepis.1
MPVARAGTRIARQACAVGCHCEMRLWAPSGRGTERAPHGGLRMAGSAWRAPHGGLRMHFRGPHVACRRRVVCARGS